MSAETAARELQANIISLIDDALAREEVSRADLSRRLDRSRASISQTLHPDNNLTLFTIAEILDNLGYRLVVDTVKNTTRRKK